MNLFEYIAGDREPKLPPTPSEHAKRILAQIVIEQSKPKETK